MRGRVALVLSLGLWLALGWGLGAAQAQPPCPPGTSWNPRLQSCVATPPACPPGASWNPRLQRCVASSKDCPSGTVWVPGQGCRPVAPPPPPPAVVVPPQPAPRAMAAPPDLPPPGTPMVVRGSSLNLRECPGRRCRALAVLPAGDTVQYLNFRNGYALVHSAATNLEGWVDYGYLTPAP